jgi:hypothetical protein
MRWTWVWVGLVAAALVGTLAAVWWHSGETTAATLAAVVAAVLAATGPLAGWLPTKAATLGTIDDRLARLATVVRVQWEQEANVRQLDDPQPIAVRWKAADPRLADHAEVIANGRPMRRGPKHTGRLEKVVDEFMRLPRRRLVVIGEPGAGKTGVLLLLVLGLLARRTPADPVPVLFSLASWDPARTSFPQWLARHLSDEYPFVRPDEAQAIVEARRVLPLLDGLDELPQGAMAAAVAMINGAGLERPLVVASRTREFARAVHAGDVLTGAAVVELEPVRPKLAERYLRLTTPPDRVARWEPVFAELRRGPSSPLAAALSTPLTVTLARTVYALDRSAEPAELVRCPSREAIEDRLLDALVPALYAGPTRWSADRACAWLAFLARHLSRRGTHDLAWWELAPGRTIGQIARAGGLGFAVGLMAGAVNQMAGAAGFSLSAPVGFGVTAGDLAGPLSWLLVDPNCPCPAFPWAPARSSGFDIVSEILIVFAAAIWTSLLSSIGGAVAVGLSRVGLGALRGPSRLALRIDRSFLQRLLIGAVIGLLLGLLSALAYSLQSSVQDALNSWEFGQPAKHVGLPRPDVVIATLMADPLTVATGLWVGVGFGVVIGLVKPSERPPTPASSLGSNRLVSVITLVVVGLSFVPVWAEVWGYGVISIDGFVFGLHGGPPLGLIEGLPFALGMAAVLPWGRYQLTHLWLALRGRLPWRLFAFLADAHQRGVLRQVGGDYQFRHARLQDWLASP